MLHRQPPTHPPMHPDEKGSPVKPAIPTKPATKATSRTTQQTVHAESQNARRRVGSQPVEEGFAEGVVRAFDGGGRARQPQDPDDDDDADADAAHESMMPRARGTVGAPHKEPQRGVGAGRVRQNAVHKNKICVVRACVWGK